MFALSISDVCVCVLCVCVSLSLSLSLVNTGLCRYWCTETHFLRHSITSFLGARGRDSRIHIIEQRQKLSQKDLSARALFTKPKKYLDFFFSNSDKHPSSSSSKPVSLISSSLFSSCVSFFIHTQHDRKRNTQKKRERCPRGPQSPWAART